MSVPWRQVAHWVEQGLAFVLMAGLTAWFVYGVWSVLQPPQF